jgi:hypothetical protein
VFGEDGVGGPPIPGGESRGSDDAGLVNGAEAVVTVEGGEVGIGVHPGSPTEGGSAIEGLPVDGFGSRVWETGRRCVDPSIRLSR